MIAKIMFVILLGFMSAQYTEIDIGYNRANGEFDKYNDDGFSIRFKYSNNIFNYRSLCAAIYVVIFNSNNSRFSEIFY